MASQIDKTTYDSDRKMDVLGVPGRLTHRTVKPGRPPELWFKQRWVSAPRPAPEYGPGARLKVELRFDDECGNGHNTFAITGEVSAPGDRDFLACGCLHDDIAEIFPDLADLVPWHLTGTDGPMHYIANTVYLAGDRDASGRRAGEPSSFDEFVQFGDNPIKHKLGRRFFEFLESADAGYDFEVIPIEADNKPTGYQFAPKYTFGGFGHRWADCPFDNEREAHDFLAALQRCEPRFLRLPTAWSQGKPRDLAAARQAAAWPDATDEQLCLPPDELRALLEARLPDLLARFARTMRECGFFISPAECTAALSDGIQPEGE